MKCWTRIRDQIMLLASDMPRKLESSTKIMNKKELHKKDAKVKPEKSFPIKYDLMQPFMAMEVYH